ncbi:MOSC domain-containing protein [Gloeocapsa sp. PCC 73106]|uniref:MOSC domain-containing protein n=1 Tax=Gloeocapsa sp. PCC 73106 TaxID=102232 RepID=UPI000696AC01|nr:MOSC domain-containing protein [Gloeocapsa sp. PCC 73106]
MNVSEIFIYPIKSCQGISLKQAEVTPKGFPWDREFMLVDPQGKFLTQRQYPQLATIKVELSPEKIILSQPAHSKGSFEFEPSLTGKEIPVQIWRDRTIAIDQGDEVADWFNQALGKSCRLVRQPPQYQRKIESRDGVQPGDTVSFADGYPYLLTASASLAELNRRIPEFSKVDMTRFRPNIVITTQEPFVEGDWQLIQIGRVDFAVVKPCIRCVITTINQDTGAKDQFKEPLRTLSTFRQFTDTGILFGENMISRSQGIIKIGDQVQVLAKRNKHTGIALYGENV